MSYTNGANMKNVPWREVFRIMIGKTLFVKICCIFSKIFNKPIGL